MRCLEIILWRVCHSFITVAKAVFVKWSYFYSLHSMCNICLQLNGLIKFRLFLPSNFLRTCFFPSYLILLSVTTILYSIQSEAKICGHVEKCHPYPCPPLCNSFVDLWWVYICICDTYKTNTFWVTFERFNFNMALKHTWLHVFYHCVNLLKMAVACRYTQAYFLGIKN